MGYLINPFRFGGFSNLYSMLFDGVNERFENTSTTNINFEYTSPFSYSVWVYHNSLGSVEFYLARPNSAFNSARVQIAKNASNLIAFRLGTTTGTTDRILGTSTTALSATTWYNIVCTYDGTNTTSAVKIYINATNDTLTTAGGVVSTSIAYDRVQIGSNFGGSQYMNGYLDEISVWDKALSGSEITELYNSGSPSDLSVHSAVSNLKSWWRMGDGLASWSGSNWTVPDEIGSNDLTSTNMENGDRTTTVP